MKLYIGDSHGKFNTFNRVASDAIAALAVSGGSVDELISVGDFGFWPTIFSFKNETGLPVRFIDGNHEDHEALKTFSFPNENWECRHIRRGTIENNTFFMGGATSIDRAQRKQGIDWFPEENISYGETNAAFDAIEAADAKEIKIFVSHDMPSHVVKYVAPSAALDRDSNRRTLSELLYVLPHVKAYVHGHHHRPMRYSAEGVSYVSLAATHEMGNMNSPACWKTCTVAIQDDGTVLDW